MRTCPKCNELNGDNRTKCWKCKASLGPIDKYKKICPKCMLIYSQRAETCDKCGGRLGIYDESIICEKQSDNSGCWMYIVSVLVPLIGVVLGCIYIARGDDELGRNLIITGVISNIIAFLIGAFLLG